MAAKGLEVGVVVEEVEIAWGATAGGALVGGVVFAVRLIEDEKALGAGAAEDGVISFRAFRKLLGLSLAMTRSAPSTTESWFKSEGLPGINRWWKISG